MDTNTQRNLSKLINELYEVHQIMNRNVQVLGVGQIYAESSQKLTKYLIYF